MTSELVADAATSSALVTWESAPTASARTIARSGRSLDGC